MFKFLAKKSSESPPQPAADNSSSWLYKLRSGLARTSSGISTLFTGVKIDDDLYDELESALLMADAGVQATKVLMDNLRKKVKSEQLTEALQVKTALHQLFLELLLPLQ